MVTPFAGVIMTISRLIDTKAVDAALRWNWRFSVLFLAAGLLCAFGWGTLFGRICCDLMSYQANIPTDNDILL